jgi:hypothetical protein
VWLLPNGGAVRLENFEIHANRLDGWATRAMLVDVPRIDIELGATALGLVRFHGDQRFTYSFTTGQELAFEVFGPLTAEQKEIIKSSVGPKTNAIADITRADRGGPVTYAMGKGQEFLDSLE